MLIPDFNNCGYIREYPYFYETHTEVFRSKKGSHLQLTLKQFGEKHYDRYGKSMIKQVWLRLTCRECG